MYYLTYILGRLINYLCVKLLSIDSYVYYFVMGKIKDLTGQRFGKLTVIKLGGKRNKSNQITWTCVCDCGTYKEVSSSMLHQGRTKSCGCLHKETSSKRTIERCTGKPAANRLEEGEASFNALYGAYRRGATRRGYSFNLSKEEFKQLTSQNCYYCGKEPSQRYLNAKCNGAYIYNGLDRVDNSKFYTIDNVLPCCTYCNTAKHTQSLEEFKSHITAIYNNFINSPLENLIHSN